MFSERPACTRSEAIRAEKEASSLRNWGAVYRSFRQFGHCDDAAIGEGYSETVGRLLANDWNHVESLITFTSADSGFERFVIRHVDETVPAETLLQIMKNAETRCPRNAKALCARLRDAAR